MTRSITLHKEQVRATGL